MRTRDERLVAAIGRRHAAFALIAEAVAATVATVAEPVTAVALLVLALALILALTLTLTLTLLALALVLTLALLLALLTLTLALRLVLVLLLLRLVEALLLRLAALTGLAVLLASMSSLGCAAIARRLRRRRFGCRRRGLRGARSLGGGAAGQGKIGLLRPGIVMGDGGLADTWLAHTLLDGGVNAPGIGGRILGQVLDSSLRVRAPGWGANCGDGSLEEVSRGVRRRTNVCRIN
ncbi:hypothetical protein GGR70_001183 [Xanthomonas campestris]|nr:hypothetical protein [Xanthomonas campestris]